MRAAKVLAPQTDTPMAKLLDRQAKVKAAKKTDKTQWSKLTAQEKDEILCVLALQAGLIEEE